MNGRVHSHHFFTHFVSIFKCLRDDLSSKHLCKKMLRLDILVYAHGLYDVLTDLKFAELEGQRSN